VKIKAHDSVGHAGSSGAFSTCKNAVEVMVTGH